MTRLKHAAVICIFVTATGTFADEGAKPQPQPVRIQGMLALNEDNSHFFGTRKPDEMTLAGLQAFVDQYAGSAVTHLFLNPNAMRASFRSRTRDAIWDPVNGKEPTDLWPCNAKRLFESGLDPYAVWIAQPRERRFAVAVDAHERRA